MLKIHRFSGIRTAGRLSAYSGFSINQLLNRVGGTENYLEQYAPTPDTGWNTVSAMGILSAYLAYYPEMTASAVAAWCYHNGIDFNYDIDLSDSSQKLSGTIYFLEDYPKPSYTELKNALNEWGQGYEIATLPSLPPAPDASLSAWDEPAPMTPAPAPAPAPQTTSFVPSQPAPQPISIAAPQPMAPTPQPAPMAPQPQIVPAAMKQPSAAAAPSSSSNNNMLIYLAIGAAILFFFMSKKGKKS